MNQEIEKQLNPNKNALFSVLSKSINDSMLLEIAKSDYETDVELNLKILNEIRDKEFIPAPLEWHPKEVLELIRWSEPDNPNWKPGSTGKRGHVMRALRDLGFSKNTTWLLGLTFLTKSTMSGYQ